jgi:hypothetical protein
MFSTGDVYHQVNDGVHRNRPITFMPPALIWHLAFWHEGKGQIGTDGKASSEAAAPGGARGPKKPELSPWKSLDRLLLELARALNADDRKAPSGERRIRDVRVFPCIDDTILLFETVACGQCFEEYGKDFSSTKSQKDECSAINRHLSLEFIYDGIFICIRCEAHFEFTMITIIAEVDRGRRQAVDGSDVSLQTGVNAHAERLIRHFQATQARAPRQDYSAATAPSARLPAEPNAENPREIGEYFFQSFWKQFSQDIFDFHSKVDSFLKDTENGFEETLFADFRGLILSNEAMDVTPIDDRAFFQEEQPPTWGHEGKRILLPLIDARGTDPSNGADFRRYECVINYMLGGNALYLCTLAPQIPEAYPKDRIPVEFIIHLNQPDRRNTDNKRAPVNKWQLGNLVQTLMVAATNRLASLKYLGPLKSAGDELALFDPLSGVALDKEAVAKDGSSAPCDGHTSNANSTIANNAKNGDQEGVSQSLRGMIEKFWTYCNTFKSKMDDKDISYRVDRSKHYMDEFWRKIKLLGIIQLDGDESYPEFIERRLGADFDAIKGIGNRYDKTLNSIILAQQRIISSQQLTTSEKLSEANDKIREIQIVADFALIGFLLPYYLCHIIENYVTERYSFYAPATIFILCLSFAFFRLYAETPRPRNREINYSESILYTILSVAAICAFAVFLQYIGIVGMKKKETRLEEISRQVTALSDRISAPSAPGREVEQQLIGAKMDGLSATLDAMLRAQRDMMELQREAKPKTADPAKAGSKKVAPTVRTPSR